MMQLAWIEPIFENHSGITMENIMATNGVHAQVSNTTRGHRRFSWLFSGIAVRLLIAFLISLVVLLAFFASSVISH
jgi:hypothetical protein